MQRLEFILSARSGAADDFAGIALQLAAGSYLLRLRESCWATAMIDEPFAKMDRTTRRAAAKQLLSLLGAGVYRQVMVISHAQDTVEIYPGQIRINVARDGSRSIETT
jgi:DNA repair exonuclease SbcCD ATPase subunit